MSDRVILVTGGAGNLGQAVTRLFLQQGERVAVPFYKTDLPGALDGLREEHGDRLHAFALDLTTERGAEAAIRETVEWGGRLDSVAHLIGGYAGGVNVPETPLEAWERMMDLNLKSAWLVARFAIPALLERGGSMVFVSSRAALEIAPGQAAYSVAKAGLLTLVRCIAAEFGDRGIRSNAVMPGVIDTEANRRAMPRADHSRWPAPEEIARVIAFLSAPDSSVVNGAAVPVHGRS